MKKFFLSFIAFLIVWTCASVGCYLLNELFGQNWFDDWHEYVIIGFAGAMGGYFGPILASWIDKKLKTK